MRYLFALLAAILLGSCSNGYEYGPTGGPLVIYSTTDRAVFQPVMDDFARLYPKVNVTYVELEAEPLYERFLAEEAAHHPHADLLLSSAMDLQVKLVNDGYAADHHSRLASDLPPWARWRNQAFGFTMEPVVMVYNRRLMAGRTVPRSRSALLASLRSDQNFWRGRIGTYDIVESSLGYFLASQDVRYSSDFGALVEAFRDDHVEQRSQTSSLLDDLVAGKIALGYNLLGSYAQARAQKNPVLQIVYPEDYALAVLRTAVIPLSARHAANAHLFLEYLLSPRGQQVLTDRSDLDAVSYADEGRGGTPRISQLRPIPLGPGLLVYLDQQKRQRMLELYGVIGNQQHEPPVP